MITISVPNEWNFSHSSLDSSSTFGSSWTSLSGGSRERSGRGMCWDMSTSAGVRGDRATVCCSFGRIEAGTPAWAAKAWVDAGNILRLSSKDRRHGVVRWSVKEERVCKPYWLRLRWLRLMTGESAGLLGAESHRSCYTNPASEARDPLFGTIRREVL